MIVLRHSYVIIGKVLADIRIEGNGSGGSKTPAEPTSADRATAPQPAPAAASVPEQPMLTEEPDSTPMEQDSAVESVPEQPMTTEEPASTPMEQVPTESEPKETQQLDTPTFGTSLAQWMAYRWPTNARRMLMNSGTVKEVDDALADIGGAGNAMACSDHRVTQVLLCLLPGVHVSFTTGTINQGKQIRVYVHVRLFQQMLLLVTVGCTQ